MTITLKFLPDAETDIRRIYDFLAVSNPSSATKAIDAIFESIDLLLTQPEMGRPFRGHPDLRQWTVMFGHNGYIIQYAIENDTLFITRLWHSREDR